MATLKPILCPYCEGTGKKLNMYDPPDESVLYGTCVSGFKIDKRKTITGREILDEPCPHCYGSLRVYPI